MLQRIKQNIAQYAAIDDSQFHYFFSLLKRKQLEKQRPLLVAGDVCSFEGYVEAGCLRVFCTDTAGTDHVLAFASEDQWVVDIDSYSSQKPAQLGITALENTSVWLIDKASKECLYQRIPAFERVFRLMAQDAVAALQQRLLANMHQTADQRYLEFRELHPGLENRVPQYEIAAYLGICPEFLSKIRRKLMGGTAPGIS
jgi:CRP-like cAMP-binding protein